jgi:hypothetical protein
MRLALRLRRGLFLPLAVLAAGSAPAPAEDGKSRATPEIARRAEAVRRHFANLGFTASFGAVEAGAAPEGLVIRDIAFTTASSDRTHRIARIEIRRLDWSEPEHPRYASFSVRGLIVPAQSLGSLAPLLGVSALTVHLDLDYRFDEAAKTAEITAGVLDAAELGEARFRLKIADLTHADYKQFVAKERRGADYEAAAGRMAMATFAGAALAFKDRALVAHLVRARAKAKAIGEADAKAQLIAILAEERRRADDASLREILDAVGTFLATPGEIAVAANPPPGISLFMLSILVFNPALLGISVTVN